MWVHFVYILFKSILTYKKMFIIRTMHTIFAQNSYKMYTTNFMQNVSHILTDFDMFDVHFLAYCTQFKTETFWLSQINELNYIKLLVINWNKSKSPCVSGKNAKFLANLQIRLKLTFQLGEVRQLAKNALQKLWFCLYFQQLFYI